MKRKLKKLYKKYKRKFNKYKRKSEAKISEYAEKVFGKAKHLYIKTTYINYIGKKLLIPFAWIKNKCIIYKEIILDTIKYFANLGLYIIMYGIPYCIAIHIISNRFDWNIHFSAGWIFVTGLAWYTLKEETPRVIRGCIPPRTGVHHE